MNQFIILAFRACLAANPAHCEDRELTFSAYDVTILQCVYGGQHQIAEWAVKHPAWRVSGRYRCTTGEQREVEA